MWPTFDPRLTQFWPICHLVWPTWPQLTHCDTENLHSSYILLHERDAFFTFDTHWTTHTHNFGSWALIASWNVTSTLHSASKSPQNTSIPLHKPCCLTSIMFQQLWQTKIHQIALWEGGTWQSHIHTLHNFFSISHSNFIFYFVEYLTQPVFLMIHNSGNFLPYKLT